MSSAPTSTDRCCPRTRSWQISCWRGPSGRPLRRWIAPSSWPPTPWWPPACFVSDFSLPPCGEGRGGGLEANALAAHRLLVDRDCLRRRFVPAEEARADDAPLGPAVARRRRPGGQHALGEGAGIGRVAVDGNVAGHFPKHGQVAADDSCAAGHGRAHREAETLR